jgi:hypothetical protein
MIANNEMEGMLKEAGITKFKLSLLILSEKTEESHEKPHSRQFVFRILFKLGISRNQFGNVAREEGLKIDRL